MKIYVLIHGGSNSSTGHTVHGATSSDVMADTWTTGGGRTSAVDLDSAPAYEPYRSEGYDENGDWK